MRINFRYILEFYFTIGIPLLYLWVLYATSLGDTLNLPSGLRLFGLLFCFVGTIMWIVSYITLGRSFGVLPKHRPRLTHGIYGRFRHPMYIGIILTFFGLSLANQSSAGLTSTLVILLPILIIRAKLEESQLQ